MFVVCDGVLYFELMGGGMCVFLNMIVIDVKGVVWFGGGCSGFYCKVLGLDDIVEKMVVFEMVLYFFYEVKNGDMWFVLDMSGLGYYCDGVFIFLLFFDGL